MNRIGIYAGLLFILLIGNGCRPRSVLSEQEMIDVLYDLHRAEGIIHVSGHEWGDDSVGVRCYAAVLQRHGITQSRFDSSLVWYTDHPKVFDKLYPEVLSRLEADKQELADLVRQQTEQLTEEVEQAIDTAASIEEVPHENVPATLIDKAEIMQKKE